MISATRRAASSNAQNSLEVRAKIRVSQSPKSITNPHPVPIRKRRQRSLREPLDAQTFRRNARLAPTNLRAKQEVAKLILFPGVVHIFVASGAVNAQHSGHFHRITRLLETLPRGALRGGFAQLLAATGQGPKTAVGPLHEQNFSAFVHDEYVAAHEWRDGLGHFSSPTSCGSVRSPTTRAEA